MREVGDSYKNEFFDYISGHTDPVLSILQNPCRRENLRTLFITVEEQGDLFGNPLDNLLDRLLERTRECKNLYNRWRQQIGSKERELSVPISFLKQFMSDYLVYLVNETPVHPSCHGGERGWSAKTSLEHHLPVNAAFSFDMADALIMSQ